MSGAEALGLACNILTVISFAHDTTRLCKAVYGGEAPGAELQSSAKLLAETSHDVQRQSEDLRQKPRTSSQKRLHDVAAKCNVAARSLQEETEYLANHHKKGDLVAMLKVTAKSTWRRNRLIKLEKSMAECRREMNTQLIHRICTQTDAISLQQKTNFATLDTRLQGLVVDIASGHRDAAFLISQTSMEVKKHLSETMEVIGKTMQLNVSSSLDTTRASIQHHTDKAISNATALILDANVAMNDRQIKQAKRDRLLGSLKFPQMNGRRNNIVDPEAETFQWILEPEREQGQEPTGTSDTSGDDSDGANGSSGYERNDKAHIPNDGLAEVVRPPFDNLLEWLQSDAQNYWISGKPGSGKSTLVKYISSSDTARQGLSVWAEHTVIVSYFFWKAGDPMQKSLRGLYCDILYQLLKEHTPALDRIVSELLIRGEHVTEPSDWSTKGLQEKLLLTLRTYPYNVCIFLDGLDEICEEDGASSVLNFMDTLFELPRIKLCVSSRPEPAFRSKLNQWPQLRLQDLTAHDMQRYSRRHLPYQPDWSYDEYETLIQGLVGKAEGVFLWLHLVVRGLQEGIDMGDKFDDLQSRLEDLPGELEHLYWDMWQRCNKNSRVYREFSSTIINLVVEACHFGTPSHIRLRFAPSFDRSSSIIIALATQPSLLENATSISAVTDHLNDVAFWGSFHDQVRNRCAGIVDFVRTAPPRWNRDIRFIHRSAYDFFVETDKGQLIRSYSQDSFPLCRLKYTAAALEVWRLPVNVRYAADFYVARAQVVFHNLCICSIDALRAVDTPMLRHSLARVFHRHAAELRRSSPVLSASFLAQSLECFEDMVLEHLRGLSDPERRDEASTVLQHLLYTGNPTPFLFESLLKVGADLAHIAIDEPGLRRFGLRGGPKSVLGAFLVRCLLHDYNTVILGKILEYPDLPLQQKVYLSLSTLGSLDSDPMSSGGLRISETIEDTQRRLLISERLWVVERAYSRSKREDGDLRGWTISVVLNLAFVLQMILENIGVPHLDRLADIHLGRHDTFMKCIACTRPADFPLQAEGGALVSYDPGCDMESKVLRALNSHIRPRQRRSLESTLDVELNRHEISLPISENYQKAIFRTPEDSLWENATVSEYQEFVWSHMDLPQGCTQAKPVPSLLKPPVMGASMRWDYSTNTST